MLMSEHDHIRLKVDEHDVIRIDVDALITNHDAAGPVIFVSDHVELAVGDV